MSEMTRNETVLLPPHKTFDILELLGYT